MNRVKLFCLIMETSISFSSTMKLVNIEYCGDSSEDFYSPANGNSSESTVTDCESKKFARQNHSEIEKRRREKMNTYIHELCNIIPSCRAIKSKLDKLTILRMAVQYIKSLRGSTSFSKVANSKPTFISEDEMKQLITENSEGFLFVVSCDRGKIIYMSDSVVNYLNIPKEDLLRKSIMDLLHPRDIGKVKEQLSSLDFLPSERLIDAKTGLPVNSDVLPPQTHLSSGAKRSFFCRMRCFMQTNGVQESLETLSSPTCKKRMKHSSERKQFVTVHCTGYIKTWPAFKLQNCDNGEPKHGNVTCLVAIGRLQQTVYRDEGNNESSVPTKLLEYVSRLSVDGKFTFADQRVTSVLGYLPQDFVGTSCYEYYHIDDIPKMAEFHKSVLSSEDTQQVEYLFRAKSGEFLKFKSKMFSFRNPWTKDVEYIVSTNTTTGISANKPTTSNTTRTCELLADTKTANTARDILVLADGTRVGAEKFGRMIADDVQQQEKNNSFNVEDSYSEDSLISSRDTSCSNLSFSSSAYSPTWDYPEVPLNTHRSYPLAISTESNSLQRGEASCSSSPVSLKNSPDLEKNQSPDSKRKNSPERNRNLSSDSGRNQSPESETIQSAESKRRQSIDYERNQPPESKRDWCKLPRIQSPTINMKLPEKNIGTGQPKETMTENADSEDEATWAFVMSMFEGGSGLDGSVNVPEMIHWTF